MPLIEPVMDEAQRAEAQAVKAELLRRHLLRRDGVAPLEPSFHYRGREFDSWRWGARGGPARPG